ncbi:MAG: YceI family protein [Lutibacter sp.]|jgi:polyisoprenoid-binding protein YceI|nr:YceI family protein [Lutibacter sp.]
MEKRTILVLALALISLSFVKAPLTNADYILDPAESNIHWQGHKPTGSHQGTVSFVSGSLEMDGAALIGGQFTADMTSIKDADGSQRLEGHLKSEDFFGVSEFPMATFEISTCQQTGSKAVITGTFTIKGIQKAVTFPATVLVKEDSVILASETFQINRTDFNITYKSTSFFDNLKDKFINDDFDLQVNILARKK